MKFSIATPTRQGLSKLRRCVGSVRGQNEVDREHIIQDACSTDGTVEWLERQQELDWRSERDGGMYDAINRSWLRASGDILSWLNCDEQYLPGTLRKVSDYFSENPTIDVVYGDALVIAENGDIISARREIRLSKAYIANGFLNAFSCTLFFRRSLYERGLLKLRNDYRYAADMDLILRLLDAGIRCAKIDDYLGAFTLDGTNLSCHQGMLDETAFIQQYHGGHKSSIMRRVVMAGRYLERLLSGSYRPVDVEYAFCIDEVPNYKTVVGRALPASYRTR